MRVISGERMCRSSWCSLCCVEQKDIKDTGVEEPKLSTNKALLPVHWFREEVVMKKPRRWIRFHTTCQWLVQREWNKELFLSSESGEGGVGSGGGVSFVYHVSCSCSNHDKTDLTNCYGYLSVKFLSSMLDGYWGSLRIPTPNSGRA